jgi:hypothetical protein
MPRNGWGAIARHFVARAEPEKFLDLADGRLLVTGRYRGHGKQGGAVLDAAFAHLIAVDQERIKSLEQYTDTARWHDAAGPLRTVLLDFDGHVATLRPNPPDKGNAIERRQTHLHSTHACQQDSAQVPTCGVARKDQETLTTPLTGNISTSTRVFLSEAPVRDDDMESLDD